MGHQWRKVNLVERDYEIMGAIEKWGILGLGQLEGLVFKKEAEGGERTSLFFNESGREIYTKACYKRLSDLEAGGYVRSQFYLNHRKLYTLTESGHEELIVSGKANLPGFRRSMSEALIDHEIKVNGVGLVLTQLLGFRVASERQLTDWNTHGAQAPKGQEALPDLWIIDKENPKAIEVELTQKSELRYKEIFYRYSGMVGFKGGAVLYLTGWPKGPETLWRIIKKHGRIQVYVASLQEFRDRQGRCEFLGYSSFQDDHKKFLKLVPDKTPEPIKPPLVPRPAEKIPFAAAAVSAQDAPPELDQWGGGGGYKPNPYAHLPPPLRPKRWG